MKQSLFYLLSPLPAPIGADLSRGVSLNRSLRRDSMTYLREDNATAKNRSRLQVLLSLAGMVGSLEELGIWGP
jgi:hypothetical protein